MLVNNNNNNIFYRHFSFRLKRVFPCKCVAYYEGDCWIKLCFTMCGWIDEWSKKMEMRINVCCRYENMWWNMKFIYFKVCSRASKRHLTFEPTQNLVQKNTRLRLRIWARMNLCVWSKVITVVRLRLYFLRFIRCYNHCKIWCEGVYQGKSFLLSVDYKKERSKIKTYRLVNCLSLKVTL